VIGDGSSFRIDHMPHGGGKVSGLGREEPRYPIEEMAEPDLLIVKVP
jgi:acyl-CoA reductase-like NAD-dependent aldehyde dehydrogenase